MSVPYPIGETSEEFKKRLFEFCFPENVGVLTFGYHMCDYCDNPSFGIYIQHEGKNVSLGNGEIRVIGKSVIYAAPPLIYHYVLAHAYCPPSEFIEAVLTGPKPGSAEHMALMKDL